MTSLKSDPAPVTMSEGFARAARLNLDRLREGETMIRADGELEGVHLMRTSCRRLRAAVKYLGDHLDRAERRSLQRGLRDLMGALGPVRDLDVLRSAVTGMETLDDREAQDLCEDLEERLAAASAKMQGVLDGEAYAELCGRLERAARPLEPNDPLTLHGPSRIMDALAGVLRRKPGDWAAAEEESLHDLRKSVKKLRYALEAFAPAYGHPVARQIDRCRDLQESLGALQDAAVFASHLQGIRTFVAGQFVATIRSRAEARLKDLPGLWERTFPSKSLARLGGHLFRRTVKPRKGAPSVGPKSAADDKPSPRPMASSR